ncbi:MAG TPA: hypothetical protein PKV76_05515 [Chitinophagales bacterium]|nr:hypothetical protein [Chitinophagales bacterium]
MEVKDKINKTLNSKGATIFKKMLEDKDAISKHLKKGGKLSELKDKFKFVKPLSTN